MIKDSKEALQQVKQITQLKQLLDKCINHLEFCNYGDSWENECAEPLIKEIKAYQLGETSDQTTRKST